MGPWWNDVATFISSPHFWATTAATLGGIWFLALLLSYYCGAPEVWIERYRKVQGLDHTGFWMEAIFAFGLTFTFYYLAVHSYPTGAEAMRAGGWFSWVTLGILALVIVGVIVQNLRTSGKELAEEIQTSHRGLYESLQSRGVWDANVRGLQRQYFFYIFAGLIGFGLLITSILIFGYGAWVDLAGLEEMKAKLGKYALPATMTAIGEPELTACQRLVLAYTDYREELLQVANAFLFPLGLFLLLFFWFLGTRYQDLFAPSTRDIYRTVASFFFLVCLPGIFIYAYVQLVATSDSVNAELRRAAQVGLAASQSTKLDELNQLQDKMIEKASVAGFLLRMLSSWGGILVILQFVLSRIESKAVRWSVFSNLIPGYLTGLLNRSRAIFSNPDEDGTSTHSAGASTTHLVGASDLLDEREGPRRGNN